MDQKHHGFLLFCSELLLLAISAFLYALSFPSFLSDKGWGFLAFFALIPMFFVIDRASWKTVWLEGALYGFLFYVLYNYWLKTFHPLAILIAPTLKALQYLLFFPLLKLGKKLFPKRGYLVQALLFTAGSWITQQGFLGYPYGNLASAFYSYTFIIQIASIAGIWGIILLAVVPQTFAAMLWDRKQKPSPWRRDIICYGIVLGIALLFDLFAFLHYEKAVPEKTVRVAAAQHSADSWKGGYETYQKNYEVLRDFSKESLSANPDMILWSETAFVPSVAWHQAHPSNPYTSKLVEDFVSFGKSLPVPLITGNPEGLVKDKELPAFLDDGSWNWKTYNTVILFGDGNILGTYRKQHLVPFTEYFPYEKQFPRFYALLKANDYKWWEQGTESTVFAYNGLHFSTPICFEDIFGPLNAKFVRNGADVLFNLSNDSWSGSVAAEMQHLSLAVFRSVENRRPMVRGTNSGITCMVTPEGKIVEPMEPFSKGWYLYEVPIGEKQGTTFYTSHPDLFAKVDVLACCLLLVYGIGRLRGRKRWVL
jgi:apolipoprotein N-acyltransferase